MGKAYWRNYTCNKNMHQKQKRRQAKEVKETTKNICFVSLASLTSLYFSVELRKERKNAYKSQVVLSILGQRVRGVSIPLAYSASRQVESVECPPYPPERVVGDAIPPGYHPNLQAESEYYLPYRKIKKKTNKNKFTYVWAGMLCLS